MDDDLRRQFKNIIYDGDNIKESRRRGVHFTFANTRRSWSSMRGSKVLHFIARRLSKIKHILYDWAFLAILGVTVAFLSAGIDQATTASGWLANEIVFIMDHSTYTERMRSFALWVLFTTSFVIVSAATVRVISPQAIGSGIPEMKTIIRGVLLKDYLTMRTLISKIIGLCLSLSSGLPIGKCGPFVHLSSIIAHQLSKVAGRFESSFRTETRRMENLAAACAVGVASTFSAPVGGVLFSIEVTTMYFSVRNYWRGFFASCCGAIAFRLMRGLLTRSEVTVNAYYQTNFSKNAFHAEELPLFALLGVLCGLLGALYINLYKRLVLFLRNNPSCKILFQKFWFIYPIAICILFSAYSYPHGMGRYFSGRIRFGWNLRDFFTDCSFKFGPELCTNNIQDRWIREDVDVLVLIGFYFVTVFFITIFCQTLPIPCGIFGPTFVIGAALGRLQGELVLYLYREGLQTGHYIHPGVYAVVGAAAFSGSVMHSVSVSVMIFEITGQLHLILPVTIATIIANAISSNMHPSWIDTIIQIKHLPFLPDIPPTNEKIHSIVAEDFMISPVFYLTKTTTYGNIREILLQGMDLLIFPVVESEHTQMLLGTVHRWYLLDLLEEHVGDVARKQEASRRVSAAIHAIDNHFKRSQSLAHESTDHDQDMGGGKARLQRKRATYYAILSSDEERIEEEDEDVCSMERGRRNALFTYRPGRESESDECRAAIVSNDSNSSMSNSEDMDEESIIKTYTTHAKRFMRKMVKKKDESSFEYDLNPEEREDWEQRRLQMTVELPDSIVEAAPFQLVRRTSLQKIHSIFSMLQLTKAFVIDSGKLVGVVALSDVRRALEDTLADKKPERKQSVFITSQSQLINAATMLLATEKIHDVLTPTLEVVRNARDESGKDHAFVQRESESIRQRGTIRRKTMHAQHSMPEDPEQEPDVKEAVAFLRKVSVCDNV